MRVCIVQPECLPWLGFFDKIARVDLVVYLDVVKFKRHYFENRNRIRLKDGPTWLTIPVCAKGRSQQRLLEVTIDNSQNWRRVHLRTLDHAYARSRWYSHYRDSLTTLYGYPWKLLVEFNLKAIESIAAELGITPSEGFIRASDLDVSGRSTELLVEICKRVGGTTYLSGISGREYLDECVFREARVNVEYQRFYHPIYRQLYEPFVPALSILDLLFMEGQRSRDVLLGEDTPRLNRMFL